MEKGVASDTWRSSLWRWEAGVRVSPEACKQSPQNVPSPERGFKGYFFPLFFFSFLGVGMIRALVVLFLCLDGLLLRFQSNANYYYYYFFVDANKMGFLYLIVHLLLWIDGASFLGGFVLNPLFLLLHPSYFLILFFFFSSSIRSQLLLFPSHPIIPKPSNSNLLQVAKDWQLSSLLSC